MESSWTRGAGFPFARSSPSEWQGHRVVLTVQQDVQGRLRQGQLAPLQAPQGLQRTSVLKKGLVGTGARHPRLRQTAVRLTDGVSSQLPPLHGGSDSGHAFRHDGRRRSKNGRSSGNTHQDGHGLLNRGLLLTGGPGLAKDVIVHHRRINVPGHLPESLIFFLTFTSFLQNFQIDPGHVSQSSQKLIEH